MHNADLQRLTHMCCMHSQEPAKYITHLAQAGASGATFQIEPLSSWQEAAELAARIREAGMRAAVALAPETGVDVILPLVEQGCVDMVGARFTIGNDSVYNNAWGHGEQERLRLSGSLQWGERR